MDMSDCSSYDDRSLSPWFPDDPIEALKERLERMEKSYKVLERCLEKAKDDIEELEDAVKRLKAAQCDCQKSMKKRKRRD